MYNWPLVAVGICAAFLGALSLVRFDPLGFSPLFRRATQVEQHLPR
ncbi:hypothetical protein ACFQ0O_07035 [Saccharopolyspora spinosporotrichia]